MQLHVHPYFINLMGHYCMAEVSGNGQWGVRKRTVVRNIYGEGRENVTVYPV